MLYEQSSRPCNFIFNFRSNLKLSCAVLKCIKLGSFNLVGFDFFKGHSVPVVLQSTFHAQACEELFKHLCISGTPKIRLHTGLLLVQLCGGERWWGQFLSNVLQELYNSEQLLIFPQDRYF